MGGLTETQKASYHDFPVEVCIEERVTEGVILLPSHTVGVLTFNIRMTYVILSLFQW